MSELGRSGWSVIKYKDIECKEDRRYFADYFERELLPLISPQVISKRQPFPFINNREMYVVVRLESKKGKRKMGIISCANAMDERLIALPSQPQKFILVEDIILHFVSRIFSKYTVKEKALIRVTRSADIDEDDHSLEGHEDYREMMENLIKQRRKLSPMRLEMTPGLGELEVLMLMNFLNLKKNQVFINNSPLDFGFVGELRERLRYICPSMFYKRLEARNNAFVENRVPMIKQILKSDLLLYTKEKFKNRAEMMKDGLLKINCSDLNFDCEVDKGQKINCQAGKSLFWITWDGRMLPCGMMNTPVAYPFRDGFDNAWKQIVNEVEELYLPKECENCKIRSACSSCGAIAYTETGRTDGKPEYMCKMTESIIEQTQLKYEELKNIK